MKMNGLDDTIFSAVYLAGQKSVLFGNLMFAVVESSLIKGMPFMAVCWGLWFARRDDVSTRKTRETVLAILIGAILAVAVNMAIEVMLPVKMRPIATPGFAYAPPNAVLDISPHWSSFPSDHAALFGALATGFCYVSWRLGLCAWIYVIVLIFLPRIYFGLHYPEDLLGGTAVGISAVMLCNLPQIKPRFAKIILNWSESRPAVFYASAFVFCFQLATLFSSLRKLMGPILKPIKMFLQSLYQ